MKQDDLLVEQIGDRFICVRGVGKMFYQDGFPISMAVSKLKEGGIEVSFLHMIDEFWNNGWSWKTIESKLKGEIEEDIDKNLQIDFEYLKSFYDLLEQPKRANGGYEESREMIFKYLFGSSSKDAIDGKNLLAMDWGRKRIKDSYPEMQ